MSEQQKEPDDSEPSPERQAALEAAYEQNRAAGRDPYAGVSIHTRGELRWILRQRDWDGGAEDDGSGTRRINLRRAILAKANLAGSQLSGADLSRVHGLWVNLAGAQLDRANLTNAMLPRATLQGASLVGATLHGARLPETDLRAAVLRHADLSSTNLSGVRMDQHTDVAGVRVDSFMYLGDINWDGVGLTDIAWDDVTILREEQWAHRETHEDEVAKESRTRVYEFEQAARAYRTLAAALRTQGLVRHADRFDERASEMRRLADYWQSHL